MLTQLLFPFLSYTLILFSLYSLSHFCFHLFFPSFLTHHSGPRPLKTMSQPKDVYIASVIYRCACHNGGSFAVNFMPRYVVSRNRIEGFAIAVHGSYAGHFIANHYKDFYKAINEDIACCSIHQDSVELYLREHLVDFLGKQDVYNKFAVELDRLVMTSASVC